MYFCHNFQELIIETNEMILNFLHFDNVLQNLLVYPKHYWSLGYNWFTIIQNDYIYRILYKKLKVWIKYLSTNWLQQYKRCASVWRIFRSNHYWNETLFSFRTELSKIKNWCISESPEERLLAMKRVVIISIIGVILVVNKIKKLKNQSQPQSWWKAKTERFESTVECI